MSVLRSIKHQPKGVMLQLLLQLLGMIGFSMIYSLVVLYCTNQLGFSDHSAYAISAAFNALAFATSVPGGVIAEKYLGFKVATIMSFVLCIIGLSFMAMPAHWALYLGLGTFIMGTGMVVPCLFVLLGKLYTKEQADLREQGFTLSYIGMNAGSFLACAVSGTISEHLGFGAAFFIGAIASVLMLPLFIKSQQLYNKGSNYLPPSHSNMIAGFVLTAVAVAATTILVYYANVCNALVIVIGVACTLYIIKLTFSYKGEEKKKLLVFIILTIISIMFWTLYSLAPSALTIFTERNVNRHVLGMLIPTADLSSLNPFFIVVLGPIIGFVWIWLKKYNIKMSIPAKFAGGTLLMGGGYLILVVGIHFSSALGFTALIWLVLSYFLQTVGELLVGPVGYAMVGMLTPKNKEGFMMGYWQLACGISGALSEYFASYTESPTRSTNPLLTNASYAHAFLWFGGITVGVAILCALIAPKLAAYCQDEAPQTKSNNDDDIDYDAQPLLT